MVLAEITVWAEADDSNTIERSNKQKTLHLLRCFLLYDFAKSRRAVSIEARRWYNLSMKNGAVNFVLHKIKAKNHPITIAEAMARMGYDHVQISEAFTEVGKTTDNLHQELLVGNDFLPTLNENLEDYFKEGNIKIFEKIIVIPSFFAKDIKIPKTLFPYPAPARVVADLMKRDKSIQVTRHVFAFRFFYALSMAVLGIVLAYVFIKTTERAIFYWQGIVSPSLLVSISILIIFSLYILQLFAHRLKNAGMSPWLSLLLLTPFLSTITNLSSSDQRLVLILSCIPILSVFIIAMLTPTHRYRL